VRLTSSARGLSWVSVVALCVTLASACDLGQGPLPIRKVLIDVDPAAAAAGVDREHVRALVKKTLDRARGVKVTEELKGGAAVLRVHVESYAGTTPGMGRTLSLGIEVTGAPEEGRMDASYRGHSVASAKGEVPLETLVEQALRDALAQVISTRGAADLASKELVTWLTAESATEEQRRRAVRILGSRRERSAVPALSKILMAEDHDLAQQALVAVTNIGDPQSVPAVIAYAEGQPPLIRKQAIDAVRAMGTREGKAWLFTLSTGHPDVEIQRQAAGALASLEGEQGTAAAPERTGEQVAEKLEPAVSPTPAGAPVVPPPAPASATP
jgi:HEAT repeats